VPDSAARDPTATPPPPTTRRAFACRCGQPVFFNNSRCLVCATPLGYEPEVALLLPLEPAGPPGLWRAVGPVADADAAMAARRFRRCANFENAAACNWLLQAPDEAVADATPEGRSGTVPVPAAAAPRSAHLPSGAVTPPRAAPMRQTLCRACRLNRTIPDQGIAEHRRWWGDIERAKRRLVSSLIALRLPVASRVSEDPQRGLAFDVLRAWPGGPHVMTGHADGIITIDVEEADDSRRERLKAALREPYRTLLGHLRHEVGHYYWQRLVESSHWLGPFRALFGDERQDYAAALRRHYEQGPPPDWSLTRVSAYASAHPWEDWAETWAHYLHMIDTLDTAGSFGLDATQVGLGYAPFTRAVLGGSSGPAAPLEPAPAVDDEFLAFVNAWLKLTGVLNELSRSMGLPDFYPFVLSGPAVRKLHLVHRVVSEMRGGAGDASVR
jgi:hypothetical protein